MATSAISGKDASASNVGGATEIRNITVEEIVDLLDATSYDSGGNREYVQGLQGVNFSWQNIGTKPSRGSNASMEFASGGNTWSGTGLIGNVSSAIPVDGVVAYDVTGSFTGSVSIS